MTIRSEFAEAAAALTALIAGDRADTHRQVVALTEDRPKTIMVLVAATCGIRALLQSMATETNHAPEEFLAVLLDGMLAATEPDS